MMKSFDCIFGDIYEVEPSESNKEEKVIILNEGYYNPINYGPNQNKYNNVEYKIGYSYNDDYQDLKDSKNYYLDQNDEENNENQVTSISIESQINLNYTGENNIQQNNLNKTTQQTNLNYTQNSTPHNLNYTDNNTSQQNNLNYTGVESDKPTNLNYTDNTTPHILNYTENSNTTSGSNILQNSVNYTGNNTTNYSNTSSYAFTDERSYLVYNDFLQNYQQSSNDLVKSNQIEQNNKVNMDREEITVEDKQKMKWNTLFQEKLSLPIDSFNQTSTGTIVL
eukprot:TRINITY_DN4490_c0_g1_i1.p1 TRINITY_DN4490_c0_g1~~TRINITY_DN4490_c0_g1_i1.p1  ORF type:complete len:280 (+),score=69.48 TRINITY_DN4490_c0_g1_i1:40-879(+)